jgi:hypothetical protein
MVSYYGFIDGCGNYNIWDMVDGVCGVLIKELIIV